LERRVGLFELIQNPNYPLDDYFRAEQTVRV
jgi:hypothetical protein